MANQTTCPHCSHIQHITEHDAFDLTLCDSCCRVFRANVPIEPERIAAKRRLRKQRIAEIRICRRGVSENGEGYCISAVVARWFRSQGCEVVRSGEVWVVR
jgi:hypothetical protein